MVQQSLFIHIGLNAHLLSGGASYRSAGIHGYQYNLLAHLPHAEDGFCFTVYAGPGNTPPDSRLSVHRSALPTQNPLVRIVWEQFIAPFALRHDKPDLFHGLAFSLPLAWHGRRVVTVHDLSFLRYPEQLPAGRRLYLTNMTRLSARRATRIIAVSQSVKSEIHTLLQIPEDQIDVTLHGVSPDFRPLPAQEVDQFRRQHNLPDRFILYLGTLEPRKNLETLVKAFARLPQRRAVKLVLAGGRGWQTESLFSLIEELDLTQDVILPGFVPGNLLPLWYNAADIFTYPSFYEGFGMPVIEAQACGTPILVSDTAALPEAASPGSILLPPDDVSVWVDRLAHYIDSKSARDEQAQRGKSWAAAFTWERTARQTIECYHRALTGST
nr:glycosyltransferase family 4 protein [Anaerolineae bacterium]